MNTGSPTRVLEGEYENNSRLHELLEKAKMGLLTSEEQKELAGLHDNPTNLLEPDSGAFDQNIIALSEEKKSQAEQAAMLTKSLDRDELADDAKAMQLLEAGDVAGYETFADLLATATPLGHLGTNVMNKYLETGDEDEGKTLYKLLKSIAVGQFKNNGLSIDSFFSKIISHAGIYEHNDFSLLVQRCIKNGSYLKGFPNKPFLFSCLGNNGIPSFEELVLQQLEKKERNDILSNIRFLPLEKQTTILSFLIEHGQGEVVANYVLKPYIYHGKSMLIEQKIIQQLRDVGYAELLDKYDIEVFGKLVKKLGESNYGFNHFSSEILINFIQQHPHILKEKDVVWEICDKIDPVNVLIPIINYLDTLDEKLAQKIKEIVKGVEQYNKIAQFFVLNKHKWTNLSQESKDFFKRYENNLWW